MRGLHIVVGVLVAGTLVQAEDFWEKKKYAEWTDKEVRQMVTNSPWARRVEIPLGAATPNEISLLSSSAASISCSVRALSRT